MLSEACTKKERVREAEGGDREKRVREAVRGSGRQNEKEGEGVE